ncbi:MAG: hypothetical protein LJE94_01280 [Deltaproteobacteria bacterium]|jgi:hypothetical protein|nr:hypothetical protein [Deltaproteobacteria bacterium]
MRKKVLGGLFVWICCLSLGMGTMGDQTAVKPPEPDVNYTATVVDQDDVSLDLEKFTMDGQTYLTGKLGKADLSIDFEKIRSILFVTADGKTKAIVTLDDRKQVELTIEHDAPFYGMSSFADVRIGLQDIKKILITGRKRVGE